MSVAERLASVLDESIVSIAEDDLDRHSGDWSARAFVARRAGTHSGRPACVVRPRSSGDVSKLLAWADESRTALVPYGGGSGVCEAIVPDGAVVVDLGAMSSVMNLDDRSMVVTVQAGITGPRLDEALRASGLMLGHEPQSMSISTVGGWIATRACGQLSARFGGIESSLVALEAVLPGGRIVRSRIAPRRATGPDVAALMLGSEGTLGIVTEATLRVGRRPDLPQVRSDRCLRFEHMAEAVGACRFLAQSDLRPTLVRLYDRDDTAIFFRNQPNAPQGALLLLSFDGFDAPARAERAVGLCGGHPEDEDLVAYWLEHRNDAVNTYPELMGGQGMLGPHALVDTMEVSGTWTVLRDLYHAMKEALGAEADICGCHLSHVYPDGACLYFTLASACSDDDHATSVHKRWWDAGMQTCIASGGSISHHHGIGRLKAPWLRQELGGWWDVLVAVKRAVDPNGIMNPGALGL
ncbi:MAG: FAD-binding oxidoreductase [Actinomycetota bacterium]